MHKSEKLFLTAILSIDVKACIKCNHFNFNHHIHILSIANCTICRALQPNYMHWCIGSNQLNDLTNDSKLVQILEIVHETYIACFMILVCYYSFYIIIVIIIILYIHMEFVMLFKLNGTRCLAALIVFTSCYIVICSDCSYFSLLFSYTAMAIKFHYNNNLTDTASCIDVSKKNIRPSVKWVGSVVFVFVSDKVCYSNYYWKVT